MTYYFIIISVVAYFKGVDEAGQCRDAHPSTGVGGRGLHFPCCRYSTRGVTEDCVPVHKQMISAMFIYNPTFSLITLPGSVSQKRQL